MHAANPFDLAAVGLTSIEISTLARVFFDGFSRRQVAEQDQVAPQTVANRVTNALRKIQAAHLPEPKRQARHRRRAHRPTFEPVDPALLNRVRLSPAGRWSLGGRRVCDP